MSSERHTVLQPIWEIRDIPLVGSLSDIRIVPYSSDYFEGMEHLYHSTYLELALENNSIRKFIQNSIKSTFSKDMHKIKKPDAVFLWLAINSLGDVVGMGGLRIVSSSCFEIQKLAVHKNYRNLGISKLIWKHIMEKGFAICVNRPLRICLSTLSLLQVAESYYSKQGFALIRKDHYKGYDLDVFEKIISFLVFSNPIPSILLFIPI